MRINVAFLLMYPCSTIVAIKKGFSFFCEKHFHYSNLIYVFAIATEVLCFKFYVVLIKFIKNVLNPHVIIDRPNVRAYFPLEENEPHWLVNWPSDDLNPSAVQLLVGQ